MLGFGGIFPLLEALSLFTQHISACCSAMKFELQTERGACVVGLHPNLSPTTASSLCGCPCLLSHFSTAVCAHRHILQCGAGPWAGLQTNTTGRRNEESGA